jgi:hypothetical protein
MSLSNHACKPDPPPLPPPVEEPKDYVLNYFDFQFAPDSKVYLDSSLHIHASFPAWALTSLKKGLYDVTIEGYGQKGPEDWPVLGIAFNDSDAFENIAVFDTSIITQQIARLAVLRDSVTIFLYLANDSYDKVTKADCNVFIKRLTFKPVAMKTAILRWDPNVEKDLAGYKIYQSLAFFQNVGKATSVILNLEAGRPYRFSVTAYDTSGNESDFSNEVEVKL